MKETIIRGRLKESTVSVGTNATAIPASAATGRKYIAVANVGGATVYLGSSSVTTSNGYPLAANSSVSFYLGDSVTLYGVVATGTCEVRVLEGC